MPETSIPATDNSADATAEPIVATDTQTADKGDNLDASKSTDTSADGDKKPADDGSGKDAPAKTEDPDLDDWIEKRKLPKPTNDVERKAYQDQRNEQREYTRTQQDKKATQDLSTAISSTKAEIKPTDDDDTLDPLEKRQNDLEAKYEAERTTRLQSEFYSQNKVTDEQHQKILEVYKEKTSRPTTPEGKKAAVELWSSPEALTDLLDLAKARLVTSVDTSEVADAAAREERERIAKESQANSTKRNATQTSAADKTADQERTERLKARYSSTK